MIQLNDHEQQFQHLPSLQQVQLNLLEVDDSLQKISTLSTKKIQKLSQQSRITIKNRVSSGQVQINEYQQFVSLDKIIQQLLTHLVKTKVQLMELSDQNFIKVSEKTINFIAQFNDSVKNYNKTLLLRQTQLGSLVFVMKNSKKPDFRQKYIAMYGQLQKFIINPQQTQKPINAIILQQAFQVQIQILKEYSDMITLLKLTILQRKYQHDIQTLKRTANKLKIINSKIVTIAQIFPYACVIDKNDLFSYKKNSQRWQKLLQSSITEKSYGDKQKIVSSFLNLKNGINMVNATMSIVHRTRQSWSGSVSKDISNLAYSTRNILKCLIFKSHAHHEAQMLISDPNDRLTKQIWNLPQQKMFKNLISAVLPSIAFSSQFYIPRLFQKFIQKQGKIQLPQVSIKDMNQYMTKLYQPNESKVQMRINCPFQLKFKQNPVKDTQSPSLKSLLGAIIKNNIPNITMINTKKDSSDYPTQVVFHIHGGGFISMSSFIHQTYIRIWSKNINVPIISVDYGKAPECPFPGGLYDCFEAYMWTLYVFRQIYDADPFRIVLVGDSAGGNLVAALINMLIQFELRVPDGIVLVYPALNLNYCNYTPSLLTALNDTILPHTFLKICVKSYLKQGLSPLNPLVSPIYTSDQVLRKYPQTRMFVGSKDPFHDDCCRLTQRLNKLGVNTKLMIFAEFPHGFLQFDMKTQAHEQSRNATKQVQKAIAQLLKKQK